MTACDAGLGSRAASARRHWLRVVAVWGLALVSVACVADAASLLGTRASIDDPRILVIAATLPRLSALLGVSLVTLVAWDALLPKLEQRKRWVRVLPDAVLFAVFLVGVGSILAYLATASVAHVPSGSIVYNPTTHVVAVDGGIGASTAARFSAVLTAHPDARAVTIDSGGGWTHGAVLMAREVAARGLTVRVVSLCASACVAVWAASPDRQMGPKAQIGLHSAEPFLHVPWLSRVLPAWLQRLGFGYGHWLHVAGFTRRTFARMDRVAPDDIWLLSPAQVRAQGVRVAVVGG